MATAEQNVAIVSGFFNSFQEEQTNPGAVYRYIEANFDPQVEYTVVGTESQLFGEEREAVLAHGGLYEGIEGVKYFFELTATERTVLDFTVDEVIGMGDSVAAFGSFKYLSPDTGDELETDWATQIKMRDGKIFRYQFYEDTYAVAAGYRQKDEPFTWSREFDGLQRKITMGTNNGDVFVGDMEVDVIFGYKGNDNLFGLDGGDSLYGGDGNDVLRGGKGSAAAMGDGEDRDQLMGEAGDDILYGSQGYDTLMGEEGIDTLYGGKDNDILYGNQGVDILRGEEGVDSLHGGKDNDMVDGGSGNDWLWGEQGSDILTGGTGSDRFVLLSSTGTDTIADFADGEDGIVLGGGLGFAQLAITDGTLGTEIRANGELLAILQGVQANLIAQADFTVIG